MSGVYGMQVLYGVDNNLYSCAGGNGAALTSINSYFDASTVPNWNNIASVKVSLLLASTDSGHTNVVETPMIVPFPSSVPADSDEFNANALDASDKHRVFRPVTFTVSLRDQIRCYGQELWEVPSP